MTHTTHFKILENKNIIHRIVSPLLGFSIKSRVGSTSTLFNAGKTTNFIYEIIGSKFSRNDILEINSLNPSKGKFLKRIQAIIDKECELKFIKTEKEMFSNNLTLIDSCLPAILSEVILSHYKNEYSKIVEIVKDLEFKNPLKYDTSSGHKFYEYKLKRFLTDVALGMMPSKVWNGVYDATGGYLIVKEDGDIVCYHVYKKNEFEDYLINNTIIVTPSSSRHKFGQIYSENGRVFIKLNLQVRFIK